MSRLGLEEALEAIRATGVNSVQNQHSLELQKETSEIEDEIASWNKRLVWATEAVKRRDALEERLAVAKAETVAAEERVAPLTAECKALEQQERSARSEKTRLDAAKMACERTLVTLPVELKKLRESATSLETTLGQLQQTVAPLEAEQGTLALRHDELEAAVNALESDLVAQREVLATTRASVLALESREAATRDAIEGGEAEKVQLSARGVAAESRFGPMAEELAVVEAELQERRAKVARLEGRNATMLVELQQTEAALEASKSEYDRVRSVLKETRRRSARLRSERNRRAEDDDAARKEIGENEALCAALDEELAALKRDVPTMLGRRDAARTALDAALEKIERFEASSLGEALVQGASDADSGAAVDARIAEAAARLNAASQEVAGRVRVLSSFSDSVNDAMSTAASRRENAQRALESLADEQRRASEEMRTTLSAALAAMETMQGQWDAAVASNADDLRALKSAASEQSAKQQGGVQRLRSMQSELEQQTKALTGMSAEQRSLEEAEATMQRRYTQLRQRRLAKAEGDWSANLDLEGTLDTVAKEAAAGAEKAAVNLLRLFNSPSKERGTDKD